MSKRHFKKWLCIGLSLLLLFVFATLSHASYQALRLDSNGYASIADGSQTGLDMGLSDFMVEMRVKLTVPTINQPSATFAYLFSKYTPGEPYYEAYFAKSTQTIEFAIDDGVNYVYVACSASYVDDLKWHSLFFVVDKDDATGFEMYVDGIEVAYTNQDDLTSMGNLDNTSEFTIGCEGALHTRRVSSFIDESRIWNFGLDGLPADYLAYIAWRAQGRNVYLATSEYDSNSWASYVTNNLSAHYKFEGDYLDETDNDNDLTAGGTGNVFPGYTLKKRKIISPSLVK